MRFPEFARPQDSKQAALTTITVMIMIDHDNYISVKNTYDGSTKSSNERDSPER
jgi:hypothetical protein